MMRGFLAILATMAIFTSGNVLALGDRDGVDNMKIADGEGTTGEHLHSLGLVLGPGVSDEFLDELFESECGRN